MSTRSSILLRVHPEDKGTYYTQSPEFQKRLGVPENNHIGQFKITEDCNYIGIYCHHDGYLSHNGKVLAENYKTYQDVLDLVAGGDTSWIDTNGSGYYAVNEDWTEMRGSRSVTRLIRCLEEIEPVSGDAEYIYVFDYETNKWKYASVPWRSDSRVVWDSLDELSDVEEALAKR